MKATSLVALVVFSGCATAQASLPPEQAAHVERRLAGETMFLRDSMFVTSFFGDSTKKLVTAVDPKLVRLLNNPDGTAVNPGQVEVILQVGTRVRVDRLELPTSVSMAERVLFTPRTLAWLYLDVALDHPGANDASTPPHVLVLRPGLKTEDELVSEVERYLTRENPVKRLEAFSDATRDAIRTKTAIVDMPAEALEMAWGPPAQKSITLEREKKREIWVWAEGQRNAVIVDGRVSELKE